MKSYGLSLTKSNPRSNQLCCRDMAMPMWTRHMDMPQVLGSISCSCPIPLRRDTTHRHATNSKYTTCSCPTPLRHDTTHTDMPQILRSIYHARVQHHSDMTNKYWDLRKCPCYMSNKCPCYITNNYQ